MKLAVKTLNEERSGFRELKESTKMMKRNDTEKKKLIEYGKKSINEIIRQDALV